MPMQMDFLLREVALPVAVSIEPSGRNGLGAAVKCGRAGRLNGVRSTSAIMLAD